MDSKYNIINNFLEFQNELKSSIYNSSFKDQLIASIICALNADGCQDININSFIIPINDQVNIIEIAPLIAKCFYNALKSDEFLSYISNINNPKLYNVYADIMNNFNYVYMLFKLGQLNNNNILLEL